MRGEEDAEDRQALLARVQAVEERLATLERRTSDRSSTVVGAQPEAGPPAGAARSGAGEEVGDLWALAGLKRRIGEHSAVLFTGSVALAGAPRYDWQQGVEVEQLLETDPVGVAASLQALGHPRRLRLLHDVLRGRTTAAALAGAEETGTTGQLYHHLRQLVAAGWLRSAGRGRYEVPPTRIVPLLVALAAARP